MANSPFVIVRPPRGNTVARISVGLSTLREALKCSRFACSSSGTGRGFGIIAATTALEDRALETVSLDADERVLFLLVDSSYRSQRPKTTMTIRPTPETGPPPLRPLPPPKGGSRVGSGLLSR